MTVTPETLAELERLREQQSRAFGCGGCARETPIHAEHCPRRNPFIAACYRELPTLLSTVRQQAERIAELEAERAGDWDGNNCSVCDSPVLYGSRHHQCGSAIMAIEQERDAALARVKELEKAAIQPDNGYDSCAFCIAVGYRGEHLFHSDYCPMRCTDPGCHCREAD